jgi:hypothetical protein
MDVLVEAGGQYLRIPYSWQTKVQTDVPPPGWYEQIRAEVEEHQRRQHPSQALNNFLAGRVR